MFMVSSMLKKILNFITHRIFIVGVLLAFQLVILVLAINKFEDYENVKKMMLDRYERISALFNQEAFYAISRMNYEADEIEPLLKDFATPETTDMELVRFACRTDEMYQTMVEEYKRNFMNLLAGHIETQDEHVNSYTRNPSLGEIDIEKAESIINRMATRAYELGKA